MHGFLLVGLGGAIGAMARFGVARLVGPWANSFPFATFLVNVAGGLLMGVLAGWLESRAEPHDEALRLLLGVGVLGGFTTFSAFSLDMVLLMQRGQLPLAILYAGASVALSVAALGLGLWLARAWA